MLINLSRIIINGITNEEVSGVYPKCLSDFCHKISEMKYANNFNVPFQPFINQLEQKYRKTNIEIEIRIIDNNYLDMILKYLESSKTINLGSTEFDITDIKIKKDNVIDLNGSVPLLPEIFTVKFESQTLFKKERQTSIGVIQEDVHYLDKELFINYLYKDLKDRFNFNLPNNIINNITNKIIVISESSQVFDVYETEDANSKDVCVAGYQTFNIKNLNKNEIQALGKMLKIATYSGVGEKKDFGYGKVRLERP